VHALPDVLARVPLLRPLSPEQRADLAGRGEIRRFPAAAIVFREGDAADGMYVVVQGGVRIVSRDADGEELELAQLGCGEVFGEMSLLDDQPRSATTACIEDSVLLQISRERFLDFFLASRTLVGELLSGLSRRIRETNAQVLETALKKRRLKDEMELERLRSLSEMVAGVAHEVNTPLGIAVTALSIIDRALADEEWAAVASPSLRSSIEDVRDAGQLLRANVQRAHDLVKSFKNLSVRQVTDALETVSLPGVVEEAMSLFRARARQAGLEVTLTTRLAPDAAQWTGFPGHLERVILNLLQNADRYAYPEGTGGQVEILLEEAGDRRGCPAFVVTFRDFGRGIAPEHLGRIFEPFFTTGRGRGGTGLGLSIVANLVKDSLRGTISAASTLGRGTTFTMVIPQVVAGAGGALAVADAAAG
jgi:signal transduction histidine kinase